MTRISNTLLWLLVSVLAARLGLSALLPFADTTEPRYAEMARIMAETGDWITPWFDIGVPFWGKPPLSFWTQALSFKLFGVSEFAGRLPSWLANVGIVWLVYNLRRYLHPDPLGHGAKTQALWAALIYATTALGFLSAGTVMIKGDNCKRADGYIAKDKIIGRVIGVLKDNQINTPRNMRPPFSIGAALISLMQHYLGLTRPRIRSIKRYIMHIINNDVLFFIYTNESSSE